LFVLVQAYPDALNALLISYSRVIVADHERIETARVLYSTILSNSLQRTVHWGLSVSWCCKQSTVHYYCAVYSTVL